MALWLDKYRPKKLNKLDFHKKQAEHLEKLVKTGDFPHLLVISFDSICTLRVNQIFNFSGSWTSRGRQENSNYGPLKGNVRIRSRPASN